MRIRQRYKRRMKPIMKTRRAEWLEFLSTKMSYRSPSKMIYVPWSIPLEVLLGTCNH